VSGDWIRYQEDDPPEMLSQHYGDEDELNNKLYMEAIKATKCINVWESVNNINWQTLCLEVITLGG